MYFFPEEQIFIDAEEARRRSAMGKDDWRVRQSVLAILSSIKESSKYGYTGTSVLYAYKGSGENIKQASVNLEKIKKQFEEAGYTLKWEYQGTPESDTSYVTYLANVSW